MSTFTEHSSVQTRNGRPTIDFDHFGPQYRTTWQQMAAQLHESGPGIAWSERHDGFWVVASWQTAHQIGDDWETFTSVNDLDGSENGGRGQTIPQNPYRLFLGESDPPFHTGRRRLEAPFFTPKALRKWQPAARRYLDEAIDKVITTGHADLLDDIIVPAAARTTLYLLGYDPDDWQDAAAAARRSIYLLPTEPGYPHDEMRRMRIGFRQMLLDRRENPRGDIISSLASGVVEGAPLGLDEGESMMNALVFGGFDTTATLVANALVYLDAHPEMSERFRTDRALRRNAMEELLRIYPPAAGIARTAVRATELNGQTIAKGERVFIWLAAANRDPKVFPDPDRIDFDRVNAKDHVSFSVGVHRCLGSPLAKIEILEMLDVIPERLAGLSITTADVEPYPKGHVPGFVHLPATFDPGVSVGPDIHAGSQKPAATMAKVTYTAHDGQRTTIEGVLGDSVMQTAVRNGVKGIIGECGGVLSCATCHVFLDPADLDKVPPINELEDEMLDGAAVDRQALSRLSCQIHLTAELDGLRVTTPEYQD